jgi:cell wall-associated NlpC family hydrolase
MSNYGFCHLSVVPLRSEASDSSEMISQLLCGECVEVLEQTEKWTRVKCLWDNYEAWVDNKQIITGIEEQDALASLRAQVQIDRYAEVEMYNATALLSIASTINTELVNKYLTIAKCRFTGRSVEMGAKAIESISQLSLKWLNTPYLWGGRSLFGIDCSGFTQSVFKMHGVKLHRDAYQQAEQGNLVSFVEEALPGDLAFFDNAEERIIHVGIVLENQQIIHASGQVRIDRLDHQGIFNVDTKKYSHKLRIIKRLF